MSTTLSDAQHFCWKTFIKINQKLDQKRGRPWDPFVMVTDLLEETGEVASAVKGLEGFNPQTSQKQKRCWPLNFQICCILSSS